VKISVKNGISINNRWNFKSSVTLSPSRNGIFTLGRRQYDGQIIIHLKRNKLVLVNRVGIERYVAGVAAKEMGLRVPREALKAQIIAARTYALAKMRQKKANTLFHLYDDQRSQVYGGLTANWVYNLAKQTAGQVLTYKKEIFPAYYSSTCGGHTEPAWDVFSGQKRIPPFKGVKCGFCKDSKHYKWTAEFSKEELAKKLFPKWKNAGKVVKIKFGKRLKGGHLKDIWITVQRGGKVLLDAYNKFRANLGASLIKSTLIYKIVDKGNKFLFKGRGWGHAVGMCQVGAIKMAQRGYKAKDILKYYFPGAKITSW
jgi:stage II sporulation protein D